MATWLWCWFVCACGSLMLIAQNKALFCFTIVVCFVRLCFLFVCLFGGGGGLKGVFFNLNSVFSNVECCYWSVDCFLKYIESLLLDWAWTVFDLQINKRVTAQVAMGWLSVLGTEISAKSWHKPYANLVLSPPHCLCTEGQWVAVLSQYLCTGNYLLARKCAYYPVSPQTSILTNNACKPVFM